MSTPCKIPLKRYKGFFFLHLQLIKTKRTRQVMANKKFSKILKAEYHMYKNKWQEKNKAESTGGKLPHSNIICTWVLTLSIYL